MTSQIAALSKRRPSHITNALVWVRHRRLGPFLLLAPVTIVLVLLLAVPLLTTVELSFYRRGPAGSIIRAFTLENYRVFLGEPVYLKILANSAVIGIVVTAVTLLLAYIPAAVLGLTRSRFKGLLLLLVLIPFWTSFVVRTYSWIVLLGRNGVVNGSLVASGVLSDPLPLLYNTGTVVLGLVHAMIPFAIVPIFASIERIEPSVLEASTTLGARPWAVFAEIIIPLSLPGLAAAALLVFIESMGAFITPQLLGSANDMMIAQLVQERFLASLDWPFGSAASVIYLIFTGLSFSALVMLGRSLPERSA